MSTAIANQILIGFCSISFVTFKDKIFLTEIAIQISLLASLVKHLPHQPIQISFSSGSVVPNMRLTKKLFHQGKQTRLLSTRLSWCPIKTNQARLSSTSEFGLSCLLSTNFTVIFDCLVCLVCWQPISPSYLVAWFVLFVINQFHLIITITSKRGKQHQCRYIRNSVGLLCRFNPLKVVLSDCSHCFQKS